MRGWADGSAIVTHGSIVIMHSDYEDGRALVCGVSGPGGAERGSARQCEHGAPGTSLPPCPLSRRPCTPASPARPPLPVEQAEPARAVAPLQEGVGGALAPKCPRSAHSAH